jgi:hypothetical protein
MRILSVAILLIACGGEPIKTGTTWTVKSTTNSVTKSFTLREGGTPVESLGPLGASESPCATGQVLAETSKGSLSVTTFGEHYTSLAVLGSTEVYHPLVPNENEYSSALASIIQERNKSAVSSQTVTVSYDPNSTIGNTTLTEYSSNFYEYDEDGEVVLDENDNPVIIDPIETDASYYGVSADEYVVRFDVGNIWMDPDSEITTGDVELLTRNDPKMGDIWSSVNGNTIYVSQGVEQVSFAAGLIQKANKVDIYEVGTLQTDGADVIVQCLNVGSNQSQSDNPAEPSTAYERSYLDQACNGTFQHVKSGTQWWVDNVLIKESSITTHIFVKKFGYEWYETDESGENCNRVTSHTFDNPLGILFVEYDLTTETMESGVTAWVE